jgi:S-DNA-T family DNA segregation ATPase FtsK/SpoIIIE
LEKSKTKLKKPLSTNLKFELYGILLLIIGIIALARLGSVGKAMAFLFRMLVGDLEPILSVSIIFFAIYQLMIKRLWTPSWSVKHSGVLLIFIGLLVTVHHGWIPKHVSMEGLSASKLISTSWTEMLKHYTPNGFVFTIHAGGGMIGGILLASLIVLFGTDGAKLLELAMFAIGLLLFTGLSYVQIASTLRKWMQIVLTRLGFTIRGIIEKNALRKSITPEVEPSRKQKDDNIADLNDTSIELNPPIVHKAQKFEQQEDTQSPLFFDFMEQVRESEQPTPPTVKTLEALVPAASAQVAVQLTANPSRGPYILPPFHLLSRPSSGKLGESADTIARDNAKKLETTLESFGVRAKVLQVVKGPAVTRYEIQPDTGVKVSRIVSLTDDIALALAAKDIRMEAPIPGKSAIGIEVPNTEVSVVSLREVMESPAFHESASKMTIVLGRDISGHPIVANLAKMPHLLVAGATGSGKSVCINGIITSVLYKAKPDEVKFLMIDPKMVELNVYNGIPHLLAPVVTDPRRASLALKKVVIEMEKRYELFSKSGTRNIEGFNLQLMEKGESALPYIIVIVDELADLMMVAAHDVEDAICRLAQMARAAGIHLIIATQRPSVDVITGVIKANIPSRIAFGVSSQVDSRTILDMAGAEKLLGRGDMLFMPVGASKAVRVQGAFLSDAEVEAVVTFCRDQEQAQYREEMVPEITEAPTEKQEDLDELFDQAVNIVIEAKQASVSLLQRRMRIGYSRAARLVDQMEAKGYVGPYEGSKPREVLITQEQFREGRLSS